MRVMAILSLLWACGGTEPLGPNVSAERHAVLEDTPRSQADQIVARVAGRPIWGSCVEAQARRGAVDRRAALDECIAFELLSQAAEQRGLTTHPEVIEETRRALANRLVELDFEQRYRTPQSLRAAVDQKLSTVRLSLPEGRASLFVRTDVGPDASAEAKERAREVAHKIQSRLAGETGLFPDHVKDIAHHIAEGSGVVLKVQNVRYLQRGEVPIYSDALFAIPDVGRVSEVVDMKEGYTVILLTERIGPTQLGREQAEAMAFAELRREQFAVWTDELARQAGITVTTSPALLDQGEE